VGIFHRFTGLLKLWFGGIMTPAPDPRVQFANPYQRQRELLGRVQQALADVSASKGRLEAKTLDVRGKLPQLEDQARRALIAQREDLARLALQRRQVALMELQMLENQVGEVQQEEHRLSLMEHRLATHIEAFQAHQDVVAARYSAAEAQVHMQEALSGVSQELTDLGTALQQAEEKTEHMEARASAIERLVDSGVLETPGLPAGDFVEQSLAEADVDKAVEAQLAALKGELPPPAQE